MLLLLFLFFVGCAVKCDESNYYVIEMPVVEDHRSQAQGHLQVYWNVPTMQCKTKNISKQSLEDLKNLHRFGIIQNKGDSFRGDKISILYDPGFFPALLRNETSGKLRFRNGGVPQEGNLELHLKIFRHVLEQSIPDEEFSGIGIIDFESWRPVFRQNFGDVHPYKSVSIEIEQKKHWWWPQAWVTAEAKRRFEEAARIFMQTTISIAKQMRPRARWGYYGFPYCFNMAANNMGENCAANVKAENEQIKWLWMESTALYPSVYSHKELSLNQLSQLIRGRVREAARVRKGSTPILPYFWFRYRNGDFLTETDLHTALKTFNQSEAAGFIIWGSSNDVNTVEKCLNLLNYVNTVLGPSVAKYTKNNFTERLDDDDDVSGNNEITTTVVNKEEEDNTSKITPSTTVTLTTTTAAVNKQDDTTTTTPSTTTDLTTAIPTTTTIASTSATDYTTENIFTTTTTEYFEDVSEHVVTVREIDYKITTEDSIENKSSFKTVERISELKKNSSLIEVINFMFKFVNKGSQNESTDKTKSKGDEQHTTFEENLLETNVSDFTTTESYNVSDSFDAIDSEKSVISLNQVEDEDRLKDSTTENLLTTKKDSSLVNSNYSTPDVLLDGMSEDEKKGVTKHAKENLENITTEVITTNPPFTTDVNTIEDKTLLIDDLLKISKDVKKGLPIHSYTTKTILKTEALDTNTNLTVEEVSISQSIEDKTTETTQIENEYESTRIKDVTTESTLEIQNTSNTNTEEIPVVKKFESNTNDLSKDSERSVIYKEGIENDVIFILATNNKTIDKHITEKPSDTVTAINSTNQNHTFSKDFIEVNGTVNKSSGTERIHAIETEINFENPSIDAQKDTQNNTLNSEGSTKNNDIVQFITERQSVFMTETNSIFINLGTFISNNDLLEHHKTDNSDISNKNNTKTVIDQIKGLPKHLFTTPNVLTTKENLSTVDTTETPKPKHDQSYDGKDDEESADQSYDDEDSNEKSDEAPVVSSSPESLTSSARATVDQVVLAV